jgi:DNA primase
MDTQPHFDAKDQVRQAVDIVDLVGDYLPLRRQGRLFVANCPWHDDSRPSLQVNPERQSWKCWVCDIGGDAFSFVMKHERLEFREALELLAERAGIDLHPTAPKAKAGSLGDKRLQLAALQWAAEQFAKCLASDPAAEPARKYLAERGISGESIARFQIGFSPPDWQWLVRRGEQAGHSPRLLERVGVVGERTGGGGFYDRFRGRVIFPICDTQSRPIAFGGRILPQLADERSAKYVNSPETQLYSKSHQLYALDLAREALGANNPVIVMEGYTDVIMAHQHGVKSAVAVCGTALGEGHLKLIRRFTDRICLVLDGDEAGQRRTNEVLGMFVANNIDLRILTLPEGDDPCDFVRREGGDRFQMLVSGAADALSHKLSHVLRGVDSLDNTLAVTKATEELLDTLAAVPMDLGESDSSMVIREQQIIARIARELRLPVEQLRERLFSLRRGKSSAGTARGRLVERSSNDRDSRSSAASMLAFEKEIFELLLIDPALVIPIASSVTISDMESPVARQLLECCLSLHEHGEEVTFERLMLRLDDEQAKNQLVTLDESARQKMGSDKEQRLADVLARRDRHRQQLALRQSLAHLRDDSIDPAEKEAMLADLFNNLKRREKGTLPTEG